MSVFHVLAYVLPTQSPILRHCDVTSVAAPLREERFPNWPRRAIETGRIDAVATIRHDERHDEHCPPRLVC
jgi:hypothetical protein